MEPDQIALSLRDVANEECPGKCYAAGFPYYSYYYTRKWCWCIRKDVATYTGAKRAVFGASKRL